MMTCSGNDMSDDWVKLTRVGVCPTCGAQVERSYSDIFFPFCKYSCKRVVQRKEEEQEKLKIIKQEELCLNRLWQAKLREERRLKELQRASDIEQIKERIAHCESKLAHYQRLSETLPSRSMKRRNAADLVKVWSKKVLQAQKVLQDLMNEEEETP